MLQWWYANNCWESHYRLLSTFLVARLAVSHSAENQTTAGYVGNCATSMWSEGIACRQDPLAVYEKRTREEEGDLVSNCTYSIVQSMHMGRLQIVRWQCSTRPISCCTCRRTRLLEQKGANLESESGGSKLDEWSSRETALMPMNAA